MSKIAPLWAHGTLTNGPPPKVTVWIGQLDENVALVQ